MKHYFAHLRFSLATLILSFLTASCADIWLLAMITTGGSSAPENTSDWLMSHDVDEDNQKIAKRFVVNKVSFKGKFSEWVKDGAEIKADIKVSSAEEIKIYLYELGKTDFAEELSYEEYFLKVRSSENEQWEGQARCHEGCELSERFSRVVHQQLLTGENLEFSFYLEGEEEFTDSSILRFSTGIHRGYEETFDKL